jgi:hypothetical protein
MTWEGGFGWIPSGWATNPVFNAVRADRTAVSSSGTPQAFALSLADVVHLSTETGPFPNFAQREGTRISWWWTRTTTGSPTGNTAWNVNAGVGMGQLQEAILELNNSAGGVRPALIINQSN